MIRAALSLVTSVGLLVLFLITLRVQFRSIQEMSLVRGRRILLCHFHLFAPRPPRHDYHVLIRDFDAAGAPGPCREVLLMNRRHWTNVLWNPGKRVWLPIGGLVLGVTRVSTKLTDAREAVELSTPYLMLLDIACAQPVGPAWARQFFLVEHNGHNPELNGFVVFASAIHRLDRPDRDTLTRNDSPADDGAPAAAGA